MGYPKTTPHAKHAKIGDWHRAGNVPPEHRATAGSLTQPRARDAIHHLCDLHRQLDQAVLTAYAFQQVKTLPENDFTRYTITPESRKTKPHPRRRRTKRHRGPS